jgi:hypothetical protein
VPSKTYQLQPNNYKTALQHSQKIKHDSSASNTTRWYDPRPLLTSKPAQNWTIPKHTTRKTCRAIKNIPAPALKLQERHCSTCRKSNTTALTLMLEIPHAGMTRSLLTSKPAHL